MITQQQVLELFEYRDGDLYWKVKPAKQVAVGAKAGCKNSHGYCVVRVNKVLYGIHRIIFLMHHGHLPEYIDHADGDRLNNRIENLRQATNIQNSYNSSTHGRNTSGHRGVSWSKVWGKWQAYVSANKKRKFLGYFEDLELAALVASEARDLYHGKFARM